jgi:hypothetical protein
MKPFDLVFIAAFFYVLGSLVWIAVLLIRGRRDRVRRNLVRLACFAGVYFLLEIAVSLAAPQQILNRGETRRFDDWCIAVTDAAATRQIETTSAEPEKFVILTLRVFSEARRVSQAAPHASVHLLDAQGNRYDVFGPGQAAYERAHGLQPSLGTRLGPLGSFSSVRVFRVPSGVRQVDVITPHGGGPGALIIGDENSFLHKRTVIRIPLEH